MKATRIVYALITILILIPILVKHINTMIGAMRSKQRKIVNRQLLYMLITCVIICGFTMSLYKFTISNEAPLVAERISDIFINSNRKGLAQSGFEDLLYRQDLALDTDIKGYDEVLDIIDFDAKYSVYLSERTYTDKDRGIIYCKYEQEDNPVYIEIGLSEDDNKWKLSTFKVLTEEIVEAVDPKMRFLAIN